MSIYDKLLGISCDKQCQDMVRSCGLAYDPEAYFNWNAEVLPISREEVENFEKKPQSNRRKRTGKGRRRLKNPERKAPANRKTRRHPKRSLPKRFCSM